MSQSSSLYLLWQAILPVAILCALWVSRQQRRGGHILSKIPGPRPPSWIKGYVSVFFGPEAWDFLEQIRAQYGPTSTISMLLGEKYLSTFDPRALHHILVKDQLVFEGEPLILTVNGLVFGKGLLATAGEHHRKQRKMLNPVFSVAHLRDMVPIFHDVVKRLHDTLAKKVAVGEQEIDILSWSSRTALELVGQAGLGYSFDSLTDERCTHPYPAAMKQLLTLVGRALALWSPFVMPLVKIFPSWFLGFFARHLPIPDVQHLTKLSNYMYELSTEIYQGKLRALEAGDEAVHEQLARRRDIMSVLLKENLKASNEDKLEDEELIGQISTITFAAMDTTSSALTRTLYLLSHKQEVQSRLRQELRAARDATGGEDISYDALVSLPYLDAICRETLRLYPPALRATRWANQDVVLPLSTPVRCTDGSIINEIPIPAGTTISVDILNTNRNPELWGPDAMEWKPERWLSPLPTTVTEAKIPGVYAHLMTFTSGGRSCIGFKFSQLEMKIVLFRLVESFEFRPSDKDVLWQTYGVLNPAVRDEVGKIAIKLPIRMTLAK